MGHRPRVRLPVPLRSGSSAGRAPPRHGGGPWFDPRSEHAPRLRLWVGRWAFTPAKRVRVPQARPFWCRSIGRTGGCHRSSTVWRGDLRLLARVAQPGRAPLSHSGWRRFKSSREHGDHGVPDVHARLWPWRSMGSTPRDHPRWVRRRWRVGLACKAGASVLRGFESLHPHHTPVAQVDRAPVSGTGGSWFESSRGYARRSDRSG